MRRRDNQRVALYRWERVVMNTPKQRFIYPENTDPMTLKQCQSLVNKVWKDYFPSKVKDTPIVTDGRGRRKACWAYGKNEIRLPRWARIKWVVLHEVAHAITSEDPKMWYVAWHGPEYARLILELWNQYLEGIDLVKARRMAEEQKPRKVVFARYRDITHTWKSQSSQMLAAREVLDGKSFTSNEETFS